jgi:hypothetical protein
MMAGPDRCVKPTRTLGLSVWVEDKDGHFICYLRLANEGEILSEDQGVCKEFDGGLFGGQSAYQSCSGDMVAQKTAGLRVETQCTHQK